MLKGFIAGLISLFLNPFTYAGKHIDGFFSGKAIYSDTAEKRIDSVSANTAQVNDTKQQFRNLYMSTVTSEQGNYQQLNPMAVSFVDDYVEKFGAKIEGIKVTGRPYLDMMENILEEHGLPAELKYLALIESNLNSNARSGVGAVGPWQFMPATARNMGLKVGS